MPTGPTSLLFAYGTLQDPRIQVEVFVRELTGTPDVLEGYSRYPVGIHDPQVIAQMGIEHYWSVAPSANPTDAVQGTVYDLTEEELLAADAYEADADYFRIIVSLRSGREAFVYVRPE